MFNPKKALVFLHIPKTAGISLNDAIVRFVQPEIIVSGWDRSVLGDYKEFETWSPDRMNHIFLSPEILHAGANYVTGHFGRGTLKHSYADAQYITILREPRARLISLWSFWRTKSDEDLFEFGTYASRVKLSRKPLKEFLNSSCIASQIDNVMVRMLLWRCDLIEGDEFIDPKNDEYLVEMALNEIDKFSFVDILENNKWVESLSGWIGGEVSVHKLNETRPCALEYRTNIDDELDSDVYRLLNDRTRLDEMIWRHVAERVIPLGLLLEHKERSFLNALANLSALVAA